MEDLQKENEYLKQRIEFLEKIIDLNTETIMDMHDTNQELINYLETMENKEKKEVYTYFSPFTGEPVLVETEKHKYMVDVHRIIFKEDK